MFTIGRMIRMVLMVVRSRNHAIRIIASKLVRIFYILKAEDSAREIESVSKSPLGAG
jgi:hypothetical protein